MAEVLVMIVIINNNNNNNLHSSTPTMCQEYSKHFIYAISFNFHKESFEVGTLIFLKVHIAM